MEIVKCILCKNSAELLATIGDYEEFNCNKCSKFRIAGSLLVEKKFKGLSKRQRENLSTLVKKESILNSPFLLNSYTFEQLLAKM
jgi:hypothetical protein